MPADRPTVPPEILRLARDRAAARRTRDWATADRLRAELEAGGWKVVDRGTDFTVEPANPPDVVDDGVVRYGSSASVPSRLEEAPVGVASVVLVATEWPEDVERAVRGLVEHGPDGTQVVVVANGVDEAVEDALASLEGAGSPGIGVELVRTSDRLGHAAALNAGLRRASASVVILLDPSIEPTGDIVTPLVDALQDPGVGVAGGFGIVSQDLRHFTDASEGTTDVDAIEAYALAFRRADVTERGPLDEHFRFYRNLDIWWSLVLRDEGEEEVPRRAVRVPLPVTRHEHRGWTSLPDDERDRQSKKNFYRILKRFATRRDLLVAHR